MNVFKLKQLINQDKRCLEKEKSYLKAIKNGEVLKGLPLEGEGDSISNELWGTKETIKGLERSIRSLEKLLNS